MSEQDYRHHRDRLPFSRQNLSHLRRRRPEEREEEVDSLLRGGNGSLVHRSAERIRLLLSRGQGFESNARGSHAL